jgi:4-oxalocrotonate tautomerase
MPVIRIEMIAGRTEDQKQRIAELVTKAMIEGAGVKSEDTWVVFEDVPRGNWAVGGTLLSRR